MAQLTNEAVLQKLFKNNFEFPEPSLIPSKWGDFEIIECCINDNLTDDSIKNKIYVAKLMSLLYSELLIIENKRTEFKEEATIVWCNYIITKLDDKIIDFENLLKLEKRSENRTLIIIEKYLEQCKEKVKSYENLVNCLQKYFDEGSFPNDVKKIEVFRINKKSFASLLNEIFVDLKSKNEPLSYEYVSFGSKHISLFKDVKLSKINFTKCTLYTYYKSNFSLKLR